MKSDFECCKICTPPKRYPGCQDHCPDGKAAKAAHDKKRANIRKQREIESNLNAADIKRVNRIRGRK